VAGDDNSRYFSLALTLSISLLALAASLWPGLGTGDPDTHLPDGFAGQRLAFTLAELVPLAAVLVSAALLVRLGHRRERVPAGQEGPP
jgi:glutamate:GABA antiporter